MDSLYESFACMYVYCVNAQCPQKPEGTGSSERTTGALNDRAASPSLLPLYLKQANAEHPRIELIATRLRDHIAPLSLKLLFISLQDGHLIMPDFMRTVTSQPITLCGLCKQCRNLQVEFAFPTLHHRSIRRLSLSC